MRRSIRAPLTAALALALVATTAACGPTQRRVDTDPDPLPDPAVAPAAAATFHAAPISLNSALAALRPPPPDPGSYVTMWDECRGNAHLTSMMTTTNKVDRRHHLRTVHVYVTATPRWTNRAATPDKRYSLRQISWDPPSPARGRVVKATRLDHKTRGWPYFNRTALRVQWTIKQRFHKTRILECERYVAEPSF